MTCSSPSTRTLIKAALASAAVALTGLAQAQAVFKITAIPDESPTELARKAAPLVKYLEHKLGTKVEFTPVSDYAAAVEALANKQVDMAWYGGFTFVQASIRSGGKVVPLVQREEDEKFRSVFISADPAIRALADLKGKTVSFGSQSSTSGHLMPRSFLLQARIDPERDFKRVAFSGAHDATIAAVAAGKVEAIDELVANPPEKARVRKIPVAGAFHTSFMEPAQEAVAQAAAQKRRCTDKGDITDLRHTAGLFDHGIPAAGQSPCGGQHQCPGAELEKCSAVDHSNAPPVSGIT